MYTPAAGPLSFGDIFSAQWFFDAYLQRDAVPLVEFQEKGGARAWRRATASVERDLVFAHGQQANAVLLGDDCEIETIRRRRGRNRLILAAVQPLPQKPTEAQRALETRAFRRFPLPPSEMFAGGIVEFQQLFAVGVDGVEAGTDAIDPRILSLDGSARLELEMRWNAYSVRRGPLTHLDNAEKLARLLSANGDADLFQRLHERTVDPDAAHVECARSIVAALNSAWEIEGGAMNAMADAYERRDGPDASRADLVSHFKKLAARAQRAAALLERSSETEPADAS